MNDSHSKGKDVTSDMLRFIDYYGTHIITQIKLGAKFQYNFTMTAKSWQDMEKNGRNKCIQV